MTYVNFRLTFEVWRRTNFSPTFDVDVWRVKFLKSCFTSRHLKTNHFTFSAPFYRFGHTITDDILSVERLFSQAALVLTAISDQLLMILVLLKISWNVYLISQNSDAKTTFYWRFNDFFGFETDLTLRFDVTKICDVDVWRNVKCHQIFTDVPITANGLQNVRAFSETTDPIFFKFWQCVEIY